MKRARLAKVHAYIISYLRSQMPTLWGKDAKQRELIDNLNLVFYELHKKHHLPVGDFPEMQRMKEMLAHCDFKKFAKLNQRLIDSMDEVLSRDIPRLMRQLGALALWLVYTPSAGAAHVHCSHAVRRCCVCRSGALCVRFV